ncbi:Biosynthetic peptidoglycan transglycosylase [Dyadobacter sp. CECT 9623]|uniref:peptidoglycan glycosyltransferase n=1 Tax=Dyadobacter linearis TaxID=2823330 RepID=A0ABM8UU96_9BACT|nr:penicillin-binding protein 1C [Dyadobacter sp. CECT 9623]CAG5071851.1 Biosynthetic peptidoglycan transglycosylase [Dyadobacter sp. CECT 9623]
MKRVPFRKLLVTAAVVVFLFLVLDFIFPFKPTIQYATQITDHRGTVIHAFLSGDDKWRLQTALPEITPLLSKTLLYKEDQYFYYHPGINPLAIARAAFRNVFTGKRTSGASTITMQVVRLTQPRERTYFNKIIEMARALQLEMHFTKTEILQMYVNLIPYGGNIEGIKSAALLYFGKPPQLLSLAEITALTIIPNRPSSLRPGTRNDALKLARNEWLMHFEKEGLFEENTIEDALNEPLQVKRLQAPRNAPHLSIRLKQQYPDQPVIATTIKIQAQKQIEEQVRNFINRRKMMNIHNASVLVVNNETMEVEAYIGSADFDNPFDGGQVDGVRAVRSPGSTLKPLLYAAAFDKGIITPKSVLNDVPGNFSGYEPENFDLRFNGPVTTTFALANSLNIPAVRILKDVSTPFFIGKLKKAGFKTIDKQAKDLGLSMILGGCGVTLEELTRLFAAFANNGKLNALKYTQSKSAANGQEIVSEEATFLVTDILTQITRPDLPTNFDNTYHLPKIAWKTGTSYGKRDAWSIGYNKRYTVGVWVGNFSGEGVPELSGANTATPLLFSIFNSLDYNSTKGWYQSPANISVRQVCPETGDIPSDFCPHAIPDQYIVGVSNYKKCQHLRWVFTDPAGRISYCTYCLPETGFEKKAYSNLAPELIAFNELQKIPYQKIPPHNPKCERVFHEGAPLIVSPNEGSEYYIQKEEPQQLQLACQAANDVEEVFWYINDKLTKKAKPQEPIFITPPMGRVKISCSDDKGRNSDVWVMVRRM